MGGREDVRPIERRREEGELEDIKGETNGTAGEREKRRPGEERKEGKRG